MNYLTKAVLIEKMSIKRGIKFTKYFINPEYLHYNEGRINITYPINTPIFYVMIPSKTVKKFYDGLFKK